MERATKPSCPNQFEAQTANCLASGPSLCCIGHHDKGGHWSYRRCRREPARRDNHREGCRGKGRTAPEGF